MAIVEKVSDIWYHTKLKIVQMEWILVYNTSIYKNYIHKQYIIWCDYYTKI